MALSIVIVGGGMVGAAAALKLAQDGHAITLIEHNPIDAGEVLTSPHIDIRVSALNLFSQALLTQLGAWQHIEKSRSAVYRRLSVHEQQSNVLEFSHSQIGERHLGHIIENSLIQASMWQEFDGHQITLKSDLGKLLKVTQTATQASLHYDNEIISADLVLACDGARSNLRNLVNIGCTGWQYAQSCMGVLVKMDAPQQDITWQEFQATGPVAFLPMQAPYANLIWYHHHDELLRLSQLDNNALKDAIIQTYPPLAGDFEIQSKAVFPLTRQHANHYSSGRVVLLGDAAHAINPLAGQGVNLGFKDVAELSESLQQEQSIELALKRYERKRRLPNLAMMSMMDACYFTFSNTNKPLSLLRNAVIKGLAKATPLQSHILKYAVGNYL